MEDRREYKVIIGSKKFFDSQVKKLEDEIDSLGYEYTFDNFLELVRISDERRNRGQTGYLGEAEIMILKNDNYHGIIDSAHDRLGALIEDLTTDDATILVHNPPIVLNTYLKSLYNRELISLEYVNEKYDIKRESNEFSANMKNIGTHIFGQSEAINEVSKSLWYLTTVERKNPYVIMLYGSSSLGKSELVREIAKNFYDGLFLEKHLSMFKNNSYSDYFFGDKPNRKSLGFDLLERESNLVFMDEFDKCPEFFYSAFYTLFDNTRFSDSTYEVDISGLVIILTSNYKSEAEMRKRVGLPIFYRIDKFIKFEEFNHETINRITLEEIESHKLECGEKINVDEVYKRVSKLIKATNENARTVKSKVQQVVEEILFEEISNEVN